MPEDRCQLPLSALHGLEVDAVTRRGKFVCSAVGGVWLAFHLARAGWLTWRESLPASPGAARTGTARLPGGFDDDTGFDLTEAGTQKRLALYVVDEPG